MNRIYENTLLISYLTIASTPLSRPKLDIGGFYMYQDFFGFTEMRFNITPDPKFVFLSPMHLDALAHLRYGVEQKKDLLY